tara:strand:- start:744 stop:1112 length:369 start_codon:yes stop_codon:yes gene_type:complete
MKTIFLYLFLFFIKINSLENLITSLEIRSGKEISNYFNSKTEIIINEKIYKGNKFQLTKTLESFFKENNLSAFRVIHKGNSENNLIYILAEYSSNDDIYRVFLTLSETEKNYIIQKFKIDSK